MKYYMIYLSKGFKINSSKQIFPTFILYFLILSTYPLFIIELHPIFYVSLSKRVNYLSIYIYYNELSGMNIYENYVGENICFIGIVYL